MPLTRLINRSHNFIKWDDQTAVRGQKELSTVPIFDNLMHQREHQYFFQAISQLADGTGDGGVRLNPHSLLVWSICIHTDHISRVLPEVNTSNEMLTHTIDHSLSVTQVPLEFPPHLEAILWIEHATGLSQDRIGRLIGVTRQAINVWKRGGKIADDNRQRLFATLDVLERAASRNSTQDQLVAWLDTPRRADGRTPAQLLEHNEINRARLLAISSPSSRLRHVPSWINRTVPKAFREGAERRQESLPPDVDNRLTSLIEEERFNTGEDGEVLLLNE